MIKKDHLLKFNRLFFIAALWNIIIAGSALILFNFINKLVFGFYTVIPYGVATFSLRIAYALILVFGIGYYIVSVDITRNRGIVWMGILGKLAVFTISLIYFHNHQISVFCMILACGDFIFAILFGIFIFMTKGSIVKEYYTRKSNS
jgi:hypothetical protein